MVSALLTVLGEPMADARLQLYAPNNESPAAADTTAALNCRPMIVDCEALDVHFRRGIQNDLELLGRKEVSLTLRRLWEGRCYLDG